MQKVRNPVQSWFDITGRLADGAKIYVGVAGADPVTNPINTYFDSALTVPAAQPIRTIGGRIVNGVSPANIFVSATDFSLAAYDSLDNLVDYSSSNFDGLSFQPLDADLTAIAALTTTAYGRALLTLDGTDPVVTEHGNETLTNKTLTGPIINGGSMNASMAILDTGVLAPNSPGPRGFPVSAQTPGALINLASTDFAKLVPNTTGGWAMPSNAETPLPPGWWTLLYNDSGSTQTVSIDGTDTLHLHGSSSTGTRTVAIRGFCTLIKVHATDVVATGDVI